MAFALPASFEREFFRALNSVVEPAVRRGIGSPRLLPAGLVVLESTGFKSGLKRRTPLVAVKLLDYLLVSTVRGDRSFWVKNLRKQPDTRYWRGGREYRAQATVLAPDSGFTRPEAMPTLVATLACILEPLTGRGWAFAILGPAPEKSGMDAGPEAKARSTNRPGTASKAGTKAKSRANTTTRSGTAAKARTRTKTRVKARARPGAKPGTTTQARAKAKTLAGANGKSRIN